MLKNKFGNKDQFNDELGELKKEFDEYDKLKN